MQNTNGCDALADPRVQEYRQLTDPDALRRAGLFVAEGRLVVRRLLASPRFRTRSVLVTETAYDALRRFLDPASARGVPIIVASQSTMNAVAGFSIHRGCLALAERPAPTTLSDLPLAALQRVVVMEGVNNPDNVGGIFRSAAALGVDAIVLGPNCGDPLYRKAVRTSMAAVLSVPFVDAGPWPDAIQILRDHGIHVVALTAAADARMIDVIARGTPRLALLVGTEGAGLSPAALAAADDRATIHMEPGMDSLNVTVATSIALFHFHASRA